MEPNRKSDGQHVSLCSGSSVSFSILSDFMFVWIFVLLWFAIKNAFSYILLFFAYFVSFFVFFSFVSLSSK